MKRTISVMLGKGSVNHNSRKFKAENVDGNRSAENIAFCNEPIKLVYKKLFDEALERYNAKQTRSDRCIDNYYEKIRTGKQEKPFHEIILQIGNKDNMAAASENGQISAQILEEYMREFQGRNPNLYVFSAHLHMDEATPHLHIDFVPFINNSQRGLETRVSLKKALAEQGFLGGSRGRTEWNQWVYSEKEQLSYVMERYGIEWQKLDTHDEHLSVLNYKKEQRAKELDLMEQTIVDKEGKLNIIEERLNLAIKAEDFVERTLPQYDNAPELQLKEPEAFVSAKLYHKHTVLPLVQRLKRVIKDILGDCFIAIRRVQSDLFTANAQIADLTKRCKRYEDEIFSLRRMKQDFFYVVKGLGREGTKKLIDDTKNKNRSRNDHYR